MQRIKFIYQLMPNVCHEARKRGCKGRGNCFKDIVGLIGKVALVADFGKGRKDSVPSDCTAEIGGQMPIVRVVNVMHVETGKALFTEGADKACRILSDKRGMPDVKATAKKLVIDLIEIANHLGRARAGAMHV